MVYILNTALKDHKKCTPCLSSFFGIGITLSQQICDQLHFSKNIKLHQLSHDQRARLVECVSQNYRIATALRADIKKHKSRLVTISSFRGFRLNRGLPCRGQRTHGNSRTCRKLNKIN